MESNRNANKLPIIYDDAEESDASFFGLPDAIVCPHCGENATINLHTEWGELIDYFYECSCGYMFEDAKDVEYASNLALCELTEKGGLANET